MRRRDTGIGFDAITVALLGRSKPVGVFIAGVLFGALKAGGYSMQAAQGIPIDIVLVVQSLIVLFIAAPPLVRAIFRLPVPGTTSKRAAKLAATKRLRREHTDLLAQVGCTGGHQTNLFLRFQHAIDNANQHYHTDVVVEPGVDDQRFQRCIRIALGRGYARDDSLEDVLDAKTGLGRGKHGLRGINADHVLDFLAGAIRVG